MTRVSSVLRSFTCKKAYGRLIAKFAYVCLLFVRAESTKSAPWRYAPSIRNILTNMLSVAFICLQTLHVSLLVSVACAFMLHFGCPAHPQHECRKTPVDASMRLDRGAMSAEPGLFLQHYVSQGGVSLLFHSYCTYLSFPNGGHPSYRKAMPIFLRRRETHLIDAPHRRVSGAFGPGRPAASFGSFY